MEGFVSQRREQGRDAGCGGATICDDGGRRWRKGANRGPMQSSSLGPPEFHASGIVSEYLTDRHASEWRQNNVRRTETRVR
jgi:hypothetical protein